MHLNKDPTCWQPRSDTTKKTSKYFKNVKQQYSRVVESKYPVSECLNSDPSSTTYLLCYPGQVSSKTQCVKFLIYKKRIKMINHFEMCLV